MKLRAAPAVAPLVTIAVAVVLSEAGNQRADTRVGAEDVVAEAIPPQKAPTINNLDEKKINICIIFYKAINLQTRGPTLQH